MTQLQTYRACRVVATSTISERQADGGTRHRNPLLFALLKQSTRVKQRMHRAQQHARRMAAAAAGSQHKPQLQVGSGSCRVHAHIRAAATRFCHMSNMKFTWLPVICRLFSETSSSPQISAGLKLATVLTSPFQPELRGTVCFRKIKTKR